MNDTMIFIQRSRDDGYIFSGGGITSPESLLDEDFVKSIDRDSENVSLFFSKYRGNYEQFLKPLKDMSLCDFRECFEGRQNFEFGPLMKSKSIGNCFSKEIYGYLAEIGYNGCIVADGYRNFSSGDIVTLSNGEEPVKFVGYFSEFKVIDTTTGGYVSSRKFSGYMYAPEYIDSLSRFKVYIRERGLDLNDLFRSECASVTKPIKGDDFLQNGANSLLLKSDVRVDYMRFW